MPWNPFERVEPPEVPVVKSRGWVRNPIDAFIAAEHEARGLTPRPEASRPVLLRRLYLDLTGLPPTPEELHAFLDDEVPDAYEKVVDRLLASPRYGERWGRHWMDVWRYSDWAGWGKQVRDSQPHIWHWRDWIVESLNGDKPYDRMVVEMLAADEDCPDDLDALRATGYLARNFKLLSREKWMQDVVDHTVQAFLGVTLGCARCHDHMYDPILQKEYYQVRAIFEPHQVRIDRVPGVLDTAKDGIPRAYDAQLDAKTLLFVRGDDRNPTGDPLSPGVPESLGGSFEVKPVVAAPRGHRSRPAQGRDPRPARREPRGGSPGPRSRSSKLERTSKDAEAIELARHDAAVAEAQLAARIAVERAEALVDQGKKGSKEWTKAADAGDGGPARSGRRAGEPGRGRWRGRRGDRPRRPSGPRPTRPTPMPSRPWPAPGRTPGSRPSTSYTPPPRTTYPATSTGRRLAFARWIADRVQPADGPGGRQPHLGPPLRPGDRADRHRLRPQRPAAVAPGPARLAGRRVHGPRLEHEGDPPPDRHQRRPTGRIRGPTRPTSPATRTTSSSGDGPRAAPRPRSSATASSPSPARSTRPWAGPTSTTRPA